MFTFRKLLWNQQSGKVYSFKCFSEAQIAHVHHHTSLDRLQLPDSHQSTTKRRLSAGGATDSWHKILQLTRTGRIDNSPLAGGDVISLTCSKSSTRYFPSDQHKKTLRHLLWTPAHFCNHTPGCWRVRTPICTLQKIGHLSRAPSGSKWELWWLSRQITVERQQFKWRWGLWRIKARESLL